MADLLPGSILLVCNANICRSPTAQLILSDALQGRSPLGAAEISSAGIHAGAGDHICEMATGMLGATYAPAAAAHRSRLITAELIAAADLVLTLEREQRGAIARLLPGSQAKTFTLIEAQIFAEAARDRGRVLASDGVASVAPLLQAMRGLVTMPEAQKRWWKRTSDDDVISVVDGHGLGDKIHSRVISETRHAARALGDALVQLPHTARA